MLPFTRAFAPHSTLPAFRPTASGVALALAVLASPAVAQMREPPLDPPAAAATTAAEPPQPQPEGRPGTSDGQITFEASGANYDDANNTVSVSGNVILRRGDQSIRADQLTWNRATGEIVAQGNIRFVDEDGNQLFTERLELTDEFKAGAMENMLYVLREGGRLAAQSGARGADGTVELSNAAYSACAVETSDGCPKQPSWRITAKRVVFDPDKKQVRFFGSQIELFGVRLLPLPTIVIATDGRPVSGLLIPDIQLSASNGVQLSETWYQRLGVSGDLAVTGYLFTKALPMVSARYRQLLSTGAFQITGYATRSSRIPIGGSTALDQTDFRGYLYANGKFQFSPNWSLTFSTRIASDRTFLRRYDISRDDRLRSNVTLERIDPDSYFSLAGWATQTLRVGDAQGQVPFAIPEIDYRRRLTDPLLGGRIQLQFNSLAITRTAGQDTQRAFASAQWDLRRITPLGQEITLTALARGDVYHSDENALSPTVSYRGNPGWQTRGVATMALDVKWPLVGGFLGGTQVLTPRFQIVASPTLRNLAVPNEDARAIDLEDSNLFALNRFPGYDRVEGGVRFTYGFDYRLDRAGWRVTSTLGQSVRLSNQDKLIPDGTGLSNKVSDIVGRTTLRLKDAVEFTWRYRLDKDTLALRRNEFDATVGNHKTYFELGYLSLNRSIDPAFEQLQDREELRMAGRIAVKKYYSVFASAVVNLTRNSQNPALNGNGFQLLRHRAGIAYTDDCIDLSFTWRRDYITTGDAKRGNAFQFSFALRNLGIR